MGFEMMIFVGDRKCKEKLEGWESATIYILFCSRAVKKRFNLN